MIISKAITNNYLKGPFWIDFFASIPMDQMAGDENSSMKTFSILKLFRVLRLNRLINYLNTADEVKHTLRIFKLVFFMILYIHFSACLWFVLCKSDQQWTPLSFQHHDRLLAKRMLKGSVAS